MNVSLGRRLMEKVKKSITITKDILIQPSNFSTTFSYLSIYKKIVFTKTFSKFTRNCRHIIILVWNTQPSCGMYGPDPPENCHLTVKKLPKT